MFKQREILEKLDAIQKSVKNLDNDQEKLYAAQERLEENYIYIRQKLDEIFTKYLDDYLCEEKIKELLKEAMNEYRREMEIPKKVAKKK